MAKKIMEEPKKANTKTNIMIYCGPSIKGVVQQFSHFNNGIPKKLKEYAANCKEVERLIVPIESLVEAKKNLTIQGTIENLSFKAIQRGEQA